MPLRRKVTVMPMSAKGAGPCDKCERSWSWIRIRKGGVIERLCFSHGAQSYLADHGGSVPEFTVSAPPVADWFPTPKEMKDRVKYQNRGSLGATS